MLLHNQEITKELKEEIKKYLETDDNKSTKPMGFNISSFMGKLAAIKSYLKNKKDLK